jgi:tetratricopeptide (TPR) repeat protein
VCAISTEDKGGQRRRRAGHPIHIPTRDESLEIYDEHRYEARLRRGCGGGPGYDWVLTTYLASTPDAPLAHFYRSLAYGAKGLFKEALAEAKAFQAVDTGRDAGGVGLIALAYANAGQKDQARELLRDLLQRDARGEHVVEYRVAAAYEALGDREEAFRWLDKQIDDREALGSWLVWLKYDPVWAAARKDPRFDEIRRRAGW